MNIKIHHIANLPPIIETAITKIWDDGAYYNNGSIRLNMSKRELGRLASDQFAAWMFLSRNVEDDANGIEPFGVAQQWLSIWKENQNA